VPVTLIVGPGDRFLSGVSYYTAQPLEELAPILPPDRLTVVDRYVADDEVPGVFATADLVVLPYRRSSASGPLHIAMSCGLPVVTISVGGLVEATAGLHGRCPRAAL